MSYGNRGQLGATSDAPVGVSLGLLTDWPYHDKVTVVADGTTPSGSTASRGTSTGNGAFLITNRGTVAQTTLPIFTVDAQLVGTTAGANNFAVGNATTSKNLGTWCLDYATGTLTPQSEAMRQTSTGTTINLGNGWWRVQIAIKADAVAVNDALLVYAGFAGQNVPVGAAFRGGNAAILDGTHPAVSASAAGNFNWKKIPTWAWVVGGGGVLYLASRKA